MWINVSPSILLVLNTFLSLAETKNCIYISPPEGTNRTSDSVEPGTEVTYQCVNWGDSFSDKQSTELEVKCQENGEWDKLPHPCKPRRCGAMPVVFNAEFDPAINLPGTAVSYKCKYGYAYPDGYSKKGARCEEGTLEWVADMEQALSSMVCKIGYCLAKPPLYDNMLYEGLNSFIDGVGIAIGSYAVQYCTEGYYYKTPNQLSSKGRCTVTSLFDPVFGACKKHQCREYLPTMTRYLTDGRDYLQNTRFKCRKEAKFPGGEVEWVMSCDNNGQWNSEPPLSGCQLGGCEKGWVLYSDYCYYFSDPTSLGLRYFYSETSCNHKNAHLATITSEEENQFIYQNTYKQSGRDYWIGYHYVEWQNSWVWFDQEYSDLHYRAWHKGYPEVYECSRITVNGVWKDRNCNSLNSYVCKKPAMCATPPEIENGGPDIPVIPDVLDVGQTITYKCNPGYSFRSDGATQREVTCLKGKYYSHIENCQPTMCPPITRPGYNVANAYVEGNQLGTYLAHVNWICKPGFVFPDRNFTKNITCLENRQWSTIPPACIKMHCRDEGTVNAIPLYYRTAYGDADLFKCNKGYEFEDGTIEITKMCLGTGQWYPDKHCWRKKCQPYVQGNATVKSSIKDKDFRFGDKVTVTCAAGYEFPDGSEVADTYCGENFHWDPYLPLCQLKKCSGGVAPVIPNAEANSTKTEVGAYIKYTCTSGYTYIDGDKERTTHCDISANWIGLPNECRNDWGEAPKNYVAAGKTASIAFAVVAIFGFILLFLIIMCLEFSEDRKIIPICKDSDDEYESDRAEDIEEEEEPVRFTMAA